MTAYNGYKLFIGMKVRVRYGFKLMNLIKNFYIRLPYPGLGSNDIGLDRGKIGSTSIVKFNRVGNKILMIQPNYSYRHYK
jgi:hypothetical protein